MVGQGFIEEKRILFCQEKLRLIIERRPKFGEPEGVAAGCR
jgi:hypothetical protein